MSPRAPHTYKPASCALTKNLRQGSRDVGEGDVTQLQRFLIAKGYLTGTGPTGYFGTLTTQAVQKWQKVAGIVSSGTPSTTGYGAIGPKSRLAFSSQCG